MKACTDCMLKSLLDNEAIGFAESAMMPSQQAREMLGLPQEELLDQLRQRVTQIDKRLCERVDALRSGDAAIGLWMLCSHDAEYPEPFLHVKPPPAMLYGIGRQEIFTEMANHPGVALVGARRATAYGRDVAFELGRDLAAAGMTVVSGMALGVDGAAHRGALQSGGRTIAVLAGGPERPYPRSHARLHEQIAVEGAIVSERPPGSRAQRWGFPARNRLIAALSVKTVVIEGTESSGAMHTVDFAEQLGQTVAAVPGPVTSPLSAGPNALIAEQNGGLVRNASDVLDQIYSVGSQLDFDDLDEKTEPDVTGKTPERVAQPQPHPPLPRPPSATDSLPHPQADVFLRIRCGDGLPAAISANLPQMEPRRIFTVLGELELAGHVERDQTGAYRVTEPDRKRVRRATR